MDTPRWTNLLAVRQSYESGSVETGPGPLEAFFEVRYLQHHKQSRALELIPQLAAEFKAQFGRDSGGLIRQRAFRAERRGYRQPQDAVAVNVFDERPESGLTRAAARGEDRQLTLERNESLEEQRAAADHEGRLVYAAEAPGTPTGEHHRGIIRTALGRRSIGGPHGGHGIRQLRQIDAPCGRIEERHRNGPVAAGNGRRAVGRVTGRRPVLRVDTGRRISRPDTLVVEEPLEIRVGGAALAVTMRTPGDDIDLVHGFLLTEGVLRTAEDVAAARYCAGTGPDGENTYNVLDVALADGVAPPSPSVTRNLYTTSSCGICGKASIDAVRTQTAYPVADDPLVMSTELLTGLPDALRAGQRVFDRTGGLHAAGLFTADGTLLALREDVGRHNAVDKAVGWAVRAGEVPLRGHLLLVSGRASFELTQKALMAGVPALAAVSAPSTLAVDLAAEAGMTLVGFLRGTAMNVYAGQARISETPDVLGGHAV